MSAGCCGNTLSNEKEVWGGKNTHTETCREDISRRIIEKAKQQEINSDKNDNPKLNNKKCKNEKRKKIGSRNNDKRKMISSSEGSEELQVQRKGRSQNPDPNQGQNRQ